MQLVKPGPLAAVWALLLIHSFSRAADADRVKFYQDKLAKNFAALQKVDSLKPYYIAYRVNDTVSHTFTANQGGVVVDKSGTARYLGVEVRVGNGKFDNTHPLRENLDF